MGKKNKEEVMDSSHKRINTTIAKSLLCILVVIITICIDWFMLLNISEPYNKMMIIIVSICIDALGILVITLWHIFPYTDLDKCKFSVDIRELQRTHALSQIWKISYIIWLTVYFILIGMSIFSSVIAAFIASDKDSSANQIILYSTISICFTTISLLVRPKEQASGYRYAFEQLSRVLQRYLGGDTECKWDDVVSTIATCEEVITKRTFDW